MNVVFLVIFFSWRLLLSLYRNAFFFLIVNLFHFCVTVHLLRILISSKFLLVLKLSDTGDLLWFITVFIDVNVFTFSVFISKGYGSNSTHRLGSSISLIDSWQEQYSLRYPFLLAVVRCVGMQCPDLFFFILKLLLISKKTFLNSTKNQKSSYIF